MKYKPLAHEATFTGIPIEECNQLHLVYTMEIDSVKKLAPYLSQGRIVRETITLKEDLVKFQCCCCKKKCRNQCRSCDSYVCYRCTRAERHACAVFPSLSLAPEF